jgi:hypothetical protein
LDCPLDVFRRHIYTLCLVDNRSQPGVPVRITPANSGCDCDFFNDAGENLAPFGISGSLLVFNAMPL